MAARETGIGAVETFMHAGKLLALDLLVKILENKAHNWGNVRQEVSWDFVFWTLSNLQEQLAIHPASCLPSGLALQSLEQKTLPHYQHNNGICHPNQTPH